MNAVEFCIMAHEGQKRKHSGEPFHVHPIAVARMIYNNDVNTSKDVLDAAYLHDVLEDTKYTVHDLRNEGFSEITIALVTECTNIYSKMPWKRADKRRTEANRIKSISCEAKTIKIADSIHNMTDFIAQDPVFARNVYIPEKRLLLDNALLDGNGKLWNVADRIIKNFMNK